MNDNVVSLGKAPQPSEDGSGEAQRIREHVRQLADQQPDFMLVIAYKEGEPRPTVAWGGAVDGVNLIGELEVVKQIFIGQMLDGEDED